MDEYVEPTSWDSQGKVKLNERGGHMIQVVNKTGGVAIHGTLLSWDDASDFGVILTPIDGLNCNAVMWSEGPDDGEQVWVVINGLAECMFIGAAASGDMARISVAGDVGGAAGYAVSDVYPVDPTLDSLFAQGIGQIMQTTTGVGLAWVNLRR